MPLWLYKVARKWWTFLGVLALVGWVVEWVVKSIALLLT